MSKSGYLQMKIKVGDFVYKPQEPDKLYRVVETRGKTILVLFHGFYRYECKRSEVVKA